MAGLKLGHTKSVGMQKRALAKIGKNRHLFYHFPEEMRKFEEHHKRELIRLTPPKPPQFEDFKQGEHWTGTDGKQHYISKTEHGMIQIYLGSGPERKEVVVPPTFFTKKATQISHAAFKFLPGANVHLDGEPHVVIANSYSTTGKRIANVGTAEKEVWVDVNDLKAPPEEPSPPAPADAPADAPLG